MNKSLLFVSFLLMVICVSCDVKKKEQITMFLHIVYDNYPRGYKTYMGEMSYSRDILMVFYVKNDTNEPLSLPICNDFDCDTSLIMKVMRNGKATLLPCTHYSKYNNKIEKGDSIAIVIHLFSSNLSDIRVDLDKNNIEEFIQELHFKCYKKENGVLKNINPHFRYRMAPNIQYKYGKLFIDYGKDNKAKEREIYENENDSIIIKQIKENLGRNYDHSDPNRMNLIDVKERHPISAIDLLRYQQNINKGILNSIIK